MTSQISFLGAALGLAWIAYMLDPTVAVTLLSSAYNGSSLALSQNLLTPFPYEFPKLSDTSHPFPVPLCNGVVLEEATVDQLQNSLTLGRLTTSQLAGCYLQRIYQTNDYLKYVTLRCLFNFTALYIEKAVCK